GGGRGGGGGGGGGGGHGARGWCCGLGQTGRSLELAGPVGRVGGSEQTACPERTVRREPRGPRKRCRRGAWRLVLRGTREVVRDRSIRRHRAERAVPSSLVGRPRVAGQRLCERGGGPPPRRGIGLAVDQ